jgi:3-hydroxyisobutyrate dehydrogenase
MGRGMAANLLRHGARLSVWNRTAARCAPLVESGATLAASPAELARRCDVLCVCVSDTPDVEAVVFGPGGMAEAFRPGQLLIDFSSISADATEEFARRAAAAGVEWIDAPVTGGDVGAREGTLTIMGGGTPAAWQRAVPVLECVGRRLFLMGPSGSGQRTKMANQIAVAGTLASMAEAMAYAQARGMDVARVIEVLGGGAAGSWSMANYGPRLLRGDMRPGFAIRLMAKDMRLVLESAAADGSDRYTVARHLAALFEQMLQEGEGERGIHSVATRMGYTPPTTAEGT